MIRLHPILIVIAATFLGVPPAVAKSPQAEIVTVKTPASQPKPSYESLTRIIEVSPGRIVVAGRRGRGQQILALNRNVVLWAHSIQVARIHDLVATSDGGLLANVLVKFPYQSKEEQQYGRGDRPAVVRFSADGRILWGWVLGFERTITVSGVAPSPMTASIFPASTLCRCIVIAAESHGMSATPSLPGLIALGNILWAKSLSVSTSFDWINAVPAADGGVIVGSNQLWRLDRNGNLAWSVRTRCNSPRAGYSRCRR